MAKTSIHIRIDEELKREAEALFEELGMNLTTAYILFTKQAVREGRIPFELSTVPTAYGVPDMTRMTKEQLDRELQKGHDDIMAGRVVSSEQVRKNMEARFEKR